MRKIKIAIAKALTGILVWAVQRKIRKQVKKHESITE